MKSKLTRRTILAGAAAAISGPALSAMPDTANAESVEPCFRLPRDMPRPGTPEGQAYFEVWKAARASTHH
jgi:hypothetical protein